MSHGWIVVMHRQEWEPRILQHSPCGICEEPIGTGAEKAAYFPNPMSNAAHEACFDKIKPLEEILILKINKIFSEKGRFEKPKDTEKRQSFEQAHIAVITAVKSQLGSSTIAAFYDTEGGPAKLEELFKTVQIGFTATFPKKLDDDEKELTAHILKPEDRRVKPYLGPYSFGKTTTWPLINQK